MLYRIYIERKNGFQNEAARIFSELTSFLGIKNLKAVRYLNRYDIDGLTGETVATAARRIFSEPQSDICYFEHIPLAEEDTVIIQEYLPGQYDQRADSARQCLSLLDSSSKPEVRCAKMVILSGPISADDTERVKNYLINPVDSRESAPQKPDNLDMNITLPGPIPLAEGFIDFNDSALAAYHKSMSLAMDMDDIRFLQSYFKKQGRNPTETEIRVLDTYWSDHCRHTTFNTELEHITIEKGPYEHLFRSSLGIYQAMRTELYAGKIDKPITLMDIAVIGAKYLKKHGFLDDVELSDEINACSIYIDVTYTNPENRGQPPEKWLLMFKNETHNHPTEIEPFGGAATCIGGAIRDPLSGRAWVYQAMRITGAADPRKPLAETLPGKLPQLKLTREAAAGFSSYGNQIGLATGQVSEIYHPGFAAKRMELGAVIAAAPVSSVVREEPEAGDVVILVGGGTGRDGIGGATGSSKVHTEESVTTAGAEVQKGNAVEERKIQRLFRNPEITRIIRRCNDFGAGGVAVAVGELAPGLEVNLDAVPKKYEGLNGTELAISESQERMAVVVREKDSAAFIAAAAAENLNAAVIARVTAENRLIMKWRDTVIVDIERSFLDTAGARKKAEACIASPELAKCPLEHPLESAAFIEQEDFSDNADTVLKKAWLANISDLACASERGLCERFDGSVGANSLLLPFGGSEQGTPEAGMAAKIPVPIPKETSTASIMTFGYDPRVCSWSPWHGAQIAVLSSLAKLAALGGDPEKARLTFQEYFERTVSREAWGKPAAALLGALEAQKAMGTAAIGGKDSMSGSFENLAVPPTLVSFAVAAEDSSRIISGAFKKAGSAVLYIPQTFSREWAPDFEGFKANIRRLRTLAEKKLILAAYAGGAGGIAEAVSKMAFGSNIGISFDEKALNTITAAAGVEKTAQKKALFLPAFGSLIVEAADGLRAEDIPENWIRVGVTVKDAEIRIGKTVITLNEIRKAWEAPLASVFPPISENGQKAQLPAFAVQPHISAGKHAEAKKNFHVLSGAKPVVLVPAFPGTNGEYDMARAFTLFGAEAKIFVFRNNTPAALAASLAEFAHAIRNSSILALSGGFSAGDEPDGSGKFIANILRESSVSDAVMDLIKARDGLILGICNGFQALIRTGLVPYGEIRSPSEEMPALTFNTIGRHISRLCRTKIISSVSPWAQGSGLTEGIYTIPISHGEGRIILKDSHAKELFAAGQIFSQYTDRDGKPAAAEPDNPNGSAFAIEGMTSTDGRILGKMGHSERSIGYTEGGSYTDLFQNIPGNKCQNIFAAGISYFF